MAGGAQFLGNGFGARFEELIVVQVFCDPHPGAAFNGFQIRRLNWEDLGGGTAGVAGQPLLEMTGPLTPSSSVSLDLVDGAPLALALV